MSWQVESTDLWFLEESTKGATLALTPSELLRQALAAEHHARMLQTAAVEELRRRQVSWTHIGELVGTTRQAAAKRWRGL